MHLRSYAACVLVWLLGGVATAEAAVIVGDVGDDTAFNSYMAGLGVFGFGGGAVDYSREIFAPQGRIGSNTSGATNEIGLHWNNPADNTPPTSSTAIAGSGSTQYVWGSAGINNVEVPFQLERTGNTITFTFGQLANFLYRATLTDPLAGQVNFLAIRSRTEANATVTSSEVVLKNVTLNGENLGSLGVSDTTSNGVPSVRNYAIGGILGDFVLTGTTTMNWQGTGTLTNSAQAWQIKAFYDVPINNTPEPGTWAVTGMALLAIAGAAGRRARG